MLTYTYRYNRTLKWFQDHPITKETCPESEYHHIVPRTCGGSNNKENIILLPTRWHYIVHCWLPAVYLEQEKQKEYESMLFAWNRLQNYKKTFRKSLQTIKEDSLLYQKLRGEYISLLKRTQPEKTKGSLNSLYKTHWWKDPNDKTKSLSIKEGDSVPEGWVRGRWATEDQKEKCRNASNGRCWFYNPTTKESKQGKFSLKEEQQLLSNGWLKGHRNPNYRSHLQIYTSNGIDRLKIKEGDVIPEGYVLLYAWNKEHPKKKKTPEELKESFERGRKLAAIALQENHKRWIENNLSLWKEMYLWYLDNNEDFEALCAKYNYTKGKTNFQYLIRKYLPEIYKFDTRKYSKPRPKIRGPYKKRKQSLV